MIGSLGSGYRNSINSVVSLNIWKGKLSVFSLVFDLLSNKSLMLTPINPKKLDNNAMKLTKICVGKVILEEPNNDWFPDVPGKVIKVNINEAITRKTIER